MALLDLFLERESTFIGVSEKNATSEPEIKAEKININARITKPIITPVVGGWTVIEFSSKRY